MKVNSILCALLLLSSTAACSNTNKTLPTFSDQISYQYLISDKDRTFTTSAFAPPRNNLKSSTKNTFEGKLVITGSPTFKLNYGTSSALPRGHKAWPKFEVEFVQDKGRLIPVNRHHGFIGDDAWSITTGVGAVWDLASDKGFSRAAFPYTIKENNANCEVNGLATFLFKNDGTISNVHIQNVAETCKFYGFEFYGTLNGQYDKYRISNKSNVVEQRNNEESGHLPSKPLA